MNLAKASRWLIGLLLAAAFSQSSSAGVIVIDDFHSGLTNLDVYDGHSSDSTLQSLLAGVIGGERRAEADYISGDGDVTLCINRRFSTTLAFNEDAATGGKAVLDYGYSSDLNADLLAAGNAFHFIFTWADLAGTINITVTSPTGTSFAGIPTPANLYTGSVDSIAYFSDFVAQSGAGADFHDIDEIHIEIVGHDGGRLRAFRD